MCVSCIFTNFDLYWAKFCGYGRMQLCVKKILLQASDGLFHYNSYYSTIIPANNSTQSSYWRLSVHIWQYEVLLFSFLINSRTICSRYVYDSSTTLLINKQMKYSILQSFSADSLYLLSYTFYLPLKSDNVHLWLTGLRYRFQPNADCFTEWASEY